MVITNNCFSPVVADVSRQDVYCNSPNRWLTTTQLLFGPIVGAQESSKLWQYTMKLLSEFSVFLQSSISQQGSRDACPATNSFLSQHWFPRTLILIPSIGKAHLIETLCQSLYALAVLQQPLDGELHVNVFVHCLPQHSTVFLCYQNCYSCNILWLPSTLSVHVGSLFSVIFDRYSCLLSEAM